MAVRFPGQITSARIANGFVWLNVRFAGCNLQHRIEVIPEPKTIPRAYRGWCFKQTGPREIEISPSITVRKAGKVILETPYRWTLEVMGKIPAPAHSADLPQWLDVQITKEKIQRDFIHR